MNKNKATASAKAPKTQTHIDHAFKVADKMGSKANTIRGLVKFFRGNPPKVGWTFCASKPIKPLLDRLPVGSGVALDRDVRYGYRFVALQDNVVQARASEAIGRCGQKSNYSTGQARTHGTAHQARWEKINYKGKFRGYTGAHLYQDYQSCVAISPSGRSALLIQESRLVRRIIAPSGLKFDKDDNGIFISRLTDGMDYHPTCADWHAKDFANQIRIGLAGNWELRRAASREEAKNKKAIANADHRGVRVGIYDAIKAGNCQTGIANFAVRHSLDITKYYRPSTLLKIANGDAQRVRLTIACAVKRHDQFTAVGAETFYPAA
jgi:hypothetical protein